ncbi:dynamin family protein [Aulosira sp. FACHB-615]|uniref:dynamin family protein n=1 Tax=Aulosira sp. FACHB-615 TaxID=2692777 RepID=UPI00168957DB|nr:dynamin family protein [Aulosira sp. FACHB-615]MBD2487194.1 dynamin family protein [Aulosira sp. FACHB-615]
MNQTVYKQYEAFQEKRKTLVALIRELQGVLHSLDMNDVENNIKQLQIIVQSDSFKVLVIGEFKRGKSTFINAMLGDEILPAYARPCTAIINEVKWGEAQRVLLHYAQTDDSQNLQPQEVSVDKLEEYVVIQDDVSELHGNRYDKVELFWPLKLCENGVEIIDSPGLNEHDIRQKVTIDYLSRVDAILFVLSCEALASKSELDVIDNILKPTGHEDIFFICNRFNMIRAKEREDVKQYGISRLAPRTKRGAERVFFISALDALEGRIEDDAERVTKSGMLQVEQELERFLANERGKIKILRPAREVQTAIKAARDTIPQRHAMLNIDLKTLEARLEGAREPLNRLKKEQEQIVTRINNFCGDIRMTVSAEGCSFYRSLPDKVNEWIKKFETKTSVNLMSLEGAKPQVERLVQEIVTHLTSQVESEFLAWQNSTLQPIISQRLEILLQELDDRAKNFVDKIDDIKFQVSGSSVIADDMGPRKVGALERVLSAAGGLVLGGFFLGGGMAAIGATFGYQEMLKSIIPQLVLGIGTVVLVGLNPWVLIPIMFGGGVVQGFITSKATTNKVKEEVGKRFAASLRDSAQQRGYEVADAVVIKLHEIRDAVNQGLGKEIQSVADQVNSIVSEKQKGQANVDQKLRELDGLRREIDVIDSELDTLIIEIAMPT